MKNTADDRRIDTLLIGLVFLLLISPVHAGQVTVPNNFSANTPAVAAEVNANFSAVATEINDNADMIAQLQTMVAALQTRLAAAEANVKTLQDTVARLDATALEARVTAIENNSVLALNNVLYFDPAAPQGPAMIVEGANLQLLNGNGATNTVNGLGNLIIGYNEEPQNMLPGDRAGSHNLVIGRQHRYTSYAGLVAGFNNSLRGPEATISGGAGESVTTREWATTYIAAKQSGMTINSSDDLIINTATAFTLNSGTDVTLQTNRNLSMSTGNTLTLANGNNFVVNTTNDTSLSSGNRFDITPAGPLYIDGSSIINIDALDNININSAATITIKGTVF
jgi:hypothetical protein